MDELATSTEVEKALTKQFGWSKADNNYQAISYYDYNVKTPSDQGSAIAVIFANGAIMDGEETGQRRRRYHRSANSRCAPRSEN